jgi:hypothetical protein
MPGGIHICCFSTALDEMPRKKQADLTEVLKVLAVAGKFSCFEASANPAIAKTMTRICQEGFVETDISCGFPWTRVTLTEKGKLAAEGLFWHGPKENPMKGMVQIGKRTWAPQAMVDEFMKKRAARHGQNG